MRDCFLLTCSLMFPSLLGMTPKTVTLGERADRVRVGATLRALREIRGWRLGDFAGELGISYAYLSNIEAGRKPLTDRLLARAAALLQVEQIAITHPRDAA